MNEPIEVVKYKGIDINIYADENCESPNDNGNDNLFLVAFHRQFSVERKGFSQDLCGQLQWDKTRIKDDDEYMHDEIKAINKKYHVFGLEAYIHSGVHLSLASEGNYPDRQWDVSTLGVVFVSRNEWHTKEKARQAAQSLLDEWNDILSGNVYGYDCEAGSCGGFYGYDHEKSGLLDHAREEIDCYIEQENKKKCTKTKAYITNSVPLLSRAQ